MTKYLVNGVKGQLGYDIVRELKKRGVKDENILAIDVNEMDITNPIEVNKIITEYKPDVIFHNAAYTNVNAAEKNRDLCEKVNYIGTKNMTEAAKKVDAKIIYISTDYVFDGTKPGYYEVTDKTCPVNNYGYTKYLGETAVKEYEKHFIVRISWVFGINGKNFLRTMLNLAETHDKVTVICDQVGSPTYTLDLSRLLVDMSESNKYGLYHATNEDICSWAELTEYLYKINNIKTTVDYTSARAYDENNRLRALRNNDEYIRVARPMNSKLSKKSLDEAGFDRLPLWKDAVNRYNEELQMERKRTR